MKNKRFIRAIKAAAKPLKKNETAVILACIMVLASFLRLYGITSLGLFPSDTGNYVRMSTWLLGAGGIPMDWEPPLTSMAIASGFLLFGIHDYAANGVMAFFGILTVLVAYITGREIFGRKAGLIAAAIMSTMELNILYSRVALAESVLTFTISVYFYFFYMAFTRKRMRYYALAGIAFGFCMLTKYTAFLCFAATACFLGAYYIADLKSGKAWKKKETLFHLKGNLLAGLIAAAMFAPWFASMGLGAYLSNGHTTEFHMSDVDLSWAISNPGTIAQYGVGELGYIFSHNTADGTYLANNPLFYVQSLLVWVSPIVLFFFALSLLRIREEKGVAFMWSAFLVFFIFYSFMITLKGDRFMAPVVVPVAVLAARGIIICAKSQRILIVLVLLAVSSGIVLSADTITSRYDAFRSVGNYIDENVAPGELVFYTGMPQILFYHETNTGNWWENGDASTVHEIRYVILDNHMKRKVFSFFDSERFEKDFTPVEVAMIQDPWEQFYHAAEKDPEYMLIKVYKPEKDISEYFSFGEAVE